MPWKTAARAWVLVYLGSTFIMASIFLTGEALMGDGIHWAAEVLAPMVGCAMFISAVGGGKRAARSASAPGRRHIQAGTWATVVAWVGLFAMAVIADALSHHADGLTRFGISICMTTLACALFVAVAHVRSRQTWSA
jgi:hypothetical protein